MLLKNSVFEVSGCRVRSIENENARSRCSEYQDVEYSRRRARTLAPGGRSG